MAKSLSWAVWIGGGLVLVAAFLLADAGTGSSLAPRWVAVYVGAICALVLLSCQRRISLDSVDILGLGFLCWAALSLLWSPDWKSGLLSLQNLLALFAIAWFVRHRQYIDKVIPVALVIGLWGAAILGAIWPQVYGGFGNENFIAEFVIAATALLMAVKWRWKHANIAILATVVVSLVYLVAFNHSHLKYLAAGGCLVALGWLAYKHRYWVFIPALGLVALVGCLGLLLDSNHLDQVTKSLTDRAEIWLNTGAMIWHNPVLGVGIGGFDYAYPRIAHIGLLGNHTFLGEPTDFVGAAHNEYLQLWAELGFIGMVIAGLLVWQVLRWGSGPGRFCLFMIGVMALVGFPLQNPACAIVAALAVGLAARGRGWCVVPVTPGNLGGLLALPLAFSAWLFYEGQTQTQYVHRLMQHSPVHALQAHLNALDTFDLHPWTRLQASLTLAVVVRTYPPNQVDLDPLAADRMHEISMSAVPNHPGILITRVEYLLNSGRHAESDEIEHLLDTLKDTGRLYAESWALEALYAGFKQDEPRMEHAVLQAFQLPRAEQVFETLGLLKRES